jgi:hypothetical protein
MTPEDDVGERKAALVDENPDVLFADGLDAAFVGYARRCGQPTLAVYDFELCCKVIMERDGIDYDEAAEYLEFNSVGAWVGENTPLWLFR